MNSSDPTTAGLERPLSLRRRHDLEVVPQIFSGQRYWAVKDPVRLRYFHLRDEEYCVWESLDGEASLADIRARFERRFAPRRLAAAQLQSFLGALHHEGLIVADAPGQGGEMLERHRRERWRNLWATLSNVLAIRFRGLDPERFLNWLEPRCRWLFSPAAGWGAAGLVLGAIALVVLKFEVIQSQLPELESLLTPSTVIWLSLALALTKVLHELGHALACRRYGGECHEMGVLLLVFTPCLYCNVSDAWMLPSKWQRAAIGAAGVVVELVLAAVCTYLWWFSEPGLFHALCFNIMLVCSVGTILFNGNPLLRYDGYFVLADLVEIPNLAQQASAEVFGALTEFVLGVPPQHDEECSPRRRILLALYATASAAYRVAVIVGIVWLLRRVLQPHGLEIVADFLGIVAVTGMVAVPLWRATKYVQQAYWSRQMKTGRACASGAIAVAGLLIALLVPLPHHVPAPAVVEAESARHVYVPVGGTIVDGVQTGAAVATGDSLAELQNRELDFEIVRLRGERDQQALRLANLKNRQAHAPRAAAEIPTAAEALADLEERLARRLDDQRRLSIKAPTAGTVLPVRSKPRTYAAGELESWTGLPLNPANRGSHFETGTLLCQIGDPARLEALLVLDQRDVEFVHAGQRVEVQLDQSPGRPLSGTIREIAEIDLKVTPAELLPEGPVPTRQDEMGIPRPVSTVYQARVSLETGSMPILIGQAGRARISAAPMSAAGRLFRYLSHTFRFEW